MAAASSPIPSPDASVYKFLSKIWLPGQVHVAWIQTRRKYGGPAKDVILFKSIFHVTEANLIHIANELFEYKKVAEKRFASSVLYVSTNPRNIHSATTKTALKFVSALGACSVDLSSSRYKPENVLFAEVQNTPGPTWFMTLDIDDKSRTNEVDDVLRGFCIRPDHVIETRGGYHYLITPAAFREANQRGLLYDALKALPKICKKSVDGKDVQIPLVDIGKDTVTPCPGTMQFDWLVQEREWDSIGTP